MVCHRVFDRVVGEDDRVQANGRLSEFVLFQDVVDAVVLFCEVVCNVF